MLRRSVVMALYTTALGVCVLSASLTACGSSKDEPEEAVSSAESISAVPVIPKETLIPEEIAASSLSETEEGPDPENVIDISIERGSYTLPILEDKPWFETVVPDVAVAAQELSILSEMKEEAAPAGTLPAGGYAAVLSDEGGGWVYVESGKVRGFLKDPVWQGSDDTDDAAEAENTEENYSEEEYTEEAVSDSGSESAEPETIPEDAVVADLLLEAADNPAYTYKMITAQENPEEAAAAVPRQDDLKILEAREEGARVIGTLVSNGTAYMLEDCGDGWLYVESGLVRGFVTKDSVLTGEDAVNYMNETGDWPSYQAVAEVPFEENRAAYYTCTSTDPGLTVQKQAREFLQLMGTDRTGEMEIPETFNGYHVGWTYTCTPDYAHRGWMYSSLEVLKIWKEYGAVYCENVAMIDDCYLIACAPTFGEVGDYVTFYLDDGRPLHCIIADEKHDGDKSYSSYGHIHDNEIDVIEAETRLAVNPGKENCVPSWGGHRVCSCVNHGAFQPYWSALEESEEAAS